MPARMCSTSDPALRLCIDFDDPTGVTKDQFAHAIEAQNLTPKPRDVEMAVAFEDDSRLHVAETPDLDIVESLTVSMWIYVDIGGLPVSSVSSRWLYDNNTQYYASLRVGGVIRCGSGGEYADSSPIEIGRWHHVTCTYERNEIRVYVDGGVGGCENLSNRPLPTGGREGMAIGANVNGGAGGPYYSEEFEGGIDNVQVFARKLEAAEVCSAAGQVSCAATCSDS